MVGGGWLDAVLRFAVLHIGACSRAYGFCLFFKNYFIFSPVCRNSILSLVRFLIVSESLSLWILI